jgi:murein L,D-transpeptidase YcbB/YkuD
MNQLCPRIHTLTVAALLLITTAACQGGLPGASGSRYPWTSETQAYPALQALVEGKSLEALVNGPGTTKSELTRLVDHVRRFYQGQNYQLIWIDGDRPSDRYRQLAKELDAADENGLPSELYKVPIEDVDGERITIPAERAPELDVRKTASFFRYFVHLTGGRLDPRSLESIWTLRPEKPELVATLTSAVRDDNLVDTMERLHPPQPEYRELQKALTRYRAIAEKGGWPALPANTRLKPGEQSAVVPVLRQRLAIEGDLDVSHEKDPSPVFDSVLVDAVKRFEERHRIKPDGILDPETLKAMNVTVQQRARTIELNLERWRWLPDTMPARYLMVNVPDFRLEAIENGRPVMDMRVVVGAPDNKTPIFADEMTHVVFSPYWNVPPGIARDETMPKAASDPDFIARNNMEVIGPKGEVVDPYSIDWSNASDLRIRQRPGSGNALGGVKFIFPNNFDVYLHDTNATKLFDRIERGLSHGCVRVEQPEALARYVLRDAPEWTPEAIQQAMQSGQEQHVKLNAPIPVYIVYKTAWVHDGGVRFLKDLYGHDADQSATLWPSRDATLDTRR